MTTLFKLNVCTQKAFIAADPPLVACRFIERFKHFTVKCPCWLGPMPTRLPVPKHLQFFFSSRDEHQATIYSVAFQEFVLERIPTPWPRFLEKMVGDLSWNMALVMLARRDEALCWQTLSPNSQWWFPEIEHRHSYALTRNLFDCRPTNYQPEEPDVVVDNDLPPRLFPQISTPPPPYPQPPPYPAQEVPLPSSTVTISSSGEEEIQVDNDEQEDQEDREVASIFQDVNKLI